MDDNTPTSNSPVPEQPTPTSQPIQDVVPASAVEPSTPESVPAPEPVLTPAIEQSPVEQSTPMKTTAPTPLSDKPKPAKGNKKGLIIGLIIGGALLFLCVAATLIMYLVTANQPATMLKSAVGKLVSSNHLTIDINTTPATDDESGAGFNLRVLADATSQQSSIAGTINLPHEDGDLTIKLDAFVNNETAFIKLDGISELLATADDEGTEALIGMFGPILDSIDGEWIEISFEELLELSEDDSMQCVADVLDSASDQNFSQSDANKIYAENIPFTIVSQLDTVDGLTPFEISTTADVTDYLSALITASTGINLQELADCSDSNTDVDADIEEVSEAKTVFYIGGGIFDRTLERSVITADSGTVTTIDINYDPIPTLSAPTSAKTIEELMLDIQEALLDVIIDQYIASGQELTDAQIEAIREQYNLTELNLLDLTSV